MLKFIFLIKYCLLAGLLLAAALAQTVPPAGQEVAVPC